MRPLYRAAQRDTCTVRSQPVIHTFIFLKDSSHSFEMNANDIFIECDDNKDIFTNAKHEWKFHLENIWAATITQRVHDVKWRRINVDATWWRRIDVETTSFLH